MLVLLHMKSFVILLFLSIGIKASAQSVGTDILLLGNPVKFEHSDSLRSVFTDKLPKNLDSFEAVFVFGTANSNLDQEDILRIDSFVRGGGGLYVGADNWPLVSEANQLTEHFYQRRFYGMNSGKFEIMSTGALQLQREDTLYPGVSTVTFPLIFDLRVEAWAGDNPVILSGELGKGRVILDGGYSRFYHMPLEADFRRRMIGYLIHEH